VKNRRGDTANRRHDDKAPSPRVSASARSRVPLITLLTDFGAEDYFVAAVKGVIFAGNPSVQIVDITHAIAPQDIEAGAFTLLAAYSSFPRGTIHVAVVDPGVGSSRRPILIEAGGHLFVGPDNGIFSYVCEQSARPQIIHLTNTKYFRQPVSSTFNGRDIFAPIAAALSKGVKPRELGEKTRDYVTLKPLRVEASSGEFVGRIIHIDRFGNCITNITQAELTPEMIAAGARLRLKRKVVKSFRRYFSEDTGSKDKVFAIWGSAGFLELAAACNSAAELLHARRGDSVIVAHA
jgi:S-adenosylmethionine hydrolase